jgi:hypothetical protein
MDIWERDLVREIMMNQMRKLSYDIEYQKGHAMFLESLNKMLR